MPQANSQRCFALLKHDRRRKPLQRFITSANHSGFSTSVRSTNLPLATLKPRVEKIFQSRGGSAKSVTATDVGTITKRGPDLDMKSTAFFLLSRVRKPCTRERKYQTTLGSSNSTEANCVFVCKYVCDSRKSW